jgi:ADP-L-glycero-D-manno-heptose 6-epimerase
MASVAMHCFDQFRENGRVKLFEGSGGYAAGQQRRDFISVDDVVRVNLHFLDHPAKSGIYNCGTGASQTFNDVAAAAINALRVAEGKSVMTLSDLRAQGLIEYGPFPAGLKDKYQSFTEADLGDLRGAGFSAAFSDVEAGVGRYVGWLLANR